MYFLVLPKILLPSIQFENLADRITIGTLVKLRSPVKQFFKHRSSTPK